MFILSRSGKRYRRTSKNERNKMYNSHLISSCIETRDDTLKILILEGTSFNYAYCHKISKL